MAAVYSLSSYSLATIAVTVASGSSSPTYIWQAAIPSTALGKSGILQIFFNLYSPGGFLANQTFNYGIYIDGVPLSIGDSTTIPYTQTAATPYAISSGGISRGTNGFLGHSPLIIPVSFSSIASYVQIGITNSSLAMAAITSVSPHISTNYTTLSGTLNTNNYIPVNTFTTTGSNIYTVPTTVQGGAVQGVYVYCWGAGGQGTCNGASRTCAGGGGAYVSAYYACAPGTTLMCIVGALNSQGNIYQGGGGAGGGGSGSQQGYNGGGFTGVFANNGGGVVQSNAIIIAGGGGGGGLGGNCAAGGGGYPTGSAPYQFSSGNTATAILGGTQTAGGIGTRNTGIALGGAGSSGQSDGGGAGGGGWYGGGSHGPGNWGSGTGYFGGAGGSSYLGTLLGASPSPAGIGPTALGSYSNGTTQTSYTAAPPGATGSTLYVSGKGYGDIDSNQNGTGLLVIIPAVGTNAIKVAASANIFTV